MVGGAAGLVVPDGLVAVTGEVVVVVSGVVAVFAGAGGTVVAAGGALEGEGTRVVGTGTVAAGAATVVVVDSEGADWSRLQPENKRKTARTRLGPIRLRYAEVFPNAFTMMHSPCTNGIESISGKRFSF
ncbi:MAG: hypothetical protein LLF99_00905 [Desulfobacteraceae bacterium]|nr:hypothetical protein [Desulfobacteraceae bacterium]